MKTKQDISALIEANTGVRVKKIKALGKGATASAVLIETDASPYKLAVKVSEHTDALKKERDMLCFLHGKAVSATPKVIFFFECEKTAFLGMTYIKGISGKSKLIPLVPDKKHLAQSILDALDGIQSVKNGTFGKYDSPKYSSWKDYYFDFFQQIYLFTMNKHAGGELSCTVMSAMDEISLRFDEIFSDCGKEACLCHGDFWMPNFIIDFKSSELKGILDPFDMLWAEPEYELFALTVGYGKSLHLYEKYKQRHKVSANCDLKVEIYALVNELHWFSVLDSIGIDYVEFRAKNVLKALCK